jgi:hypothetical protein
MGLPLQSQTEIGVRRAESQKRLSLSSAEARVELKMDGRRGRTSRSCPSEYQLPQGRVRDSTHIMNKKSIRCNTIRKEAKAGVAQVVSA